MLLGRIFSFIIVTILNSGQAAPHYALHAYKRPLGFYTRVNNMSQKHIYALIYISSQHPLLCHAFLYIYFLYYMARLIRSQNIFITHDQPWRIFLKWRIKFKGPNSSLIQEFSKTFKLLCALMLQILFIFPH